MSFEFDDEMSNGSFSYIPFLCALYLVLKGNCFFICMPNDSTFSFGLAHEDTVSIVKTAKSYPIDIKLMHEKKKKTIDKPFFVVL